MLLVPVLIVEFPLQTAVEEQQEELLRVRHQAA
jgi:hypothetical protein